MADDKPKTEPAKEKPKALPAPPPESKAGKVSPLRLAESEDPKRKNTFTD